MYILFAVMNMPFTVHQIAVGFDPGPQVELCQKAAG